MPMSTLEQLIRFGNDAAGIERMLRMVQAITMVITSQPLLTNYFSELISLGNKHVWTEPRVTSPLILTELRGKVALARRFLRMFRFLQSFYAAHTLYTSFYTQPPPPAKVPAPGPAEADLANAELKPVQANMTTHTHTHISHHHHHQHQQKRRNGIPADAWLDIFGRTFNGMYLLLETLTLIDALQLTGLSVWGSSWSTILHVEGQRFWFFALACGFSGGLVKMVKLFAYAPVPPTGEGYGTGEGKDESQLADWEKERERLRRIVRANKERRRAWKGNIKARWSGLARRCVADFLDLAVPGSVVGWVRLGPGTVGLVMLVTTYLTGKEIWDRCGREVGRA